MSFFNQHRSFDQMRFLLAALLLSLGNFLHAAESANPVVLMETNKGNIRIELWADKAPITVANFLRYTEANFYNGLIFHRVIPSFMIQGGGFNPAMVQSSTFEPIKNEATSELKNLRGTLAMARTQVVDSASSQFFINLVDADDTARGFGYAVFGEVIEGMDVVDMIATVPTGNAQGHQNVPLEPVIITSVRRE
jgi:cyclophilin family peptidyl-prolyl cis-trans isomerase